MLYKFKNKSVWPIYRKKYIKINLTPSPYIPTVLPRKWSEAINFTWNGLAAHKWNDLTR